MSELIQQALSSHELWKTKLREAIRTSNAEALNPDKVVRTDLCNLGRWLIVFPVSVRRTPRFVAIEEAHSEFHRAAAEVIQLVLEDRLESASEMMVSGRFARSSSQLIALLTEWDQEIEKSATAR